MPIKPTRNTFGLGADQTTERAYVYKPALRAAEDTKAAIEGGINGRNAAKAAADLWWVLGRDAQPSLYP